MKDVIKITLTLNVLMFLMSCNFTEKQSDALAQTNAEVVDLTEPNLVTIKTADFVFLEVPDTISSGMNTFRIENQGAFPHNAAIARLTGDHTYDEMIEYVEGNDGRFPEWAVFMGGPSAPLSGETSEASLELYPGNYAIICGVPVPAGVPHFMKGMTIPLTVTKTNKNNARAPQEDLTMTMDDYSFKMDPEITAGTKTIRVENAADQSHEFILARLEEGKTAGDLLNWLGTVTSADAGTLPPAPGKFLNGVSEMEKGLENFITVDFSPGEYALICPILDEGDGRPHFMHGMVHQFTVEAE